MIASSHTKARTNDSALLRPPPPLMPYSTVVVVVMGSSALITIFAPYAVKFEQLLTLWVTYIPLMRAMPAYPPISLPRLSFQSMVPSAAALVLVVDEQVLIDTYSLMPIEISLMI